MGRRRTISQKNINDYLFLRFVWLAPAEANEKMVKFSLGCGLSELGFGLYKL
jgi:hypothetical protein